MTLEQLPKDDKVADQIRLYKFKCRVLMNEKKPFEDNFDIYRKYKDYNYFKDIFDNESRFNFIVRQVANQKAKRYRTYQKIKYAFIDAKNEGRILVFGTMNFNDKAFFLNGDHKGREIKEETRTKQVNEWINERMDYAVVTIDYGEKNGREHHHFAGILSKEYEKKLRPVILKSGKQAKSKKGFPLYELENDDSYKIGFNPDFEIVEHRSDDYLNKRLSNYMTKISNHNAKLSTRNRRFRVLGKQREIYKNKECFQEYLREKYYS